LCFVADLEVIPGRFSAKVAAVRDGCRFWVEAIADDEVDRPTTAAPSASTAATTR
jgi:hypothetical protein